MKKADIIKNKLVKLLKKSDELTIQNNSSCTDFKFEYDSECGWRLCTNEINMLDSIDIDYIYKTIHLLNDLKYLKQ